MLQNLRETWQRASLGQRLLLIVVVLASIGAVVLLVSWAGKPDMALLYSGLAPEEAAKIVEKIRESETPYQLRDGGTAIYVAQDKVYTLRLELAGEGIPAGGQPGYRILDEEKIGTSPFTQQINYRRALEGEIARSIQLIQGVQSARLHIVKPDTQVFAKGDRAASATVFLRLKPGWRMAPANVAAIVHLVAGSVDSLKPENVVVVDSNGNLLSGEGQQSIARGANSFFSYKTQVEDYYVRKVEDMLTAVLGPNRASVRVNATVDTTSSTETKETYDPSAKVPTKEETKTKSAGAGAAPAEGASGTGTSKEENSTTDYLVGRSVTQQISAPGKILSISVAAFVDLSAPAKPAAAEAGAAAATPPAQNLTLQDVEKIIRNAVGLKETDPIQVVNVPFNRPEVSTEASPEEVSQQSRAFYLDIARQASLGVLVLGALVALKMFGGSRKKAGLTPAGPVVTGASVGGGINLLTAGSFEGDPGLLRSRIAAALEQNPEDVKRLFLAWAEGEKGEV